MHADDTGWPLCGKNGWLWVMAAIDTVIYRIRPNRKADVVRDALGLESPAAKGSQEGTRENQADSGF